MVHPDFSGGERAANGKQLYYGIPFIKVNSKMGTPFVPVHFVDYGDVRPASQTLNPMIKYGPPRKPNI